MIPLMLAPPTGTTYTYDAENHLVSTAGVTYTYDGDAKRIMKSNGTIYWYGERGAGYANQASPIRHVDSTKSAGGRRDQQTTRIQPAEVGEARMLIAYRIAYGLVLAAFLGNLAIATGERPPAATFLLLVVAAVLLLCISGLLVRFSRTQPTTFWVLVLSWEALFVWYAWFSPASPFVFHEAHALDASAVARESTVHYLKAGILFGLLFAWFLSLPVARMKWKGRALDV